MSGEEPARDVWSAQTGEKIRKIRLKTEYENNAPAVRRGLLFAV